MSDWTKEEIENLRRLAEAGLSASQIAGEVGKTRNAVMGKLMRAGIKLSRKSFGGRGTLSNVSVATRVNVAVLNKMRREPWRPKTRVETPRTEAELVHLQCSLLDLTNEKCRWPLENGKFCGDYADLRGSTPYCRRHAEVARRKREGMIRR